MISESRSGHDFELDRANFPNIAVNSETVIGHANAAQIKPGGLDSRLLVSMATTTVGCMNSLVLGEQTQHFPNAIQLAKFWSLGKVYINPVDLRNQWHILYNDAYSLASSIGHELAETKPDSYKQEDAIRDPRVQARYVTGSLMLYILYQDPNYLDYRTTKPYWHAKQGATSLASIILTDAAKIMSRTGKNGNHQDNIYSAIQNELSNWGEI